MSFIQVAVGVIRQGDKVLVARRPDHVHQGGLLEFPGGKVEPGETTAQALDRELHEELGIRVAAEAISPLIGIRHDYGDKRVFLDVCLIDSYSGEPHGREGQPVFWLDIAALQDADFPAANRPIIRALRLPDRYLITGAAESPQSLLSRLEKVLNQHCLPLVVLRAPNLNDEDYVLLAASALTLCRRHDVRLMLHGNPQMLDRVPADGVHLPWRLAADLDDRPVRDNLLLGVSCHSIEQLQHASTLKADLATLSPVMPTQSHPEAPPIGWSGFETAVAQSHLPVYALGGLGEADITTARQHGGRGVAAISAWW
ncbi:Nudix family hydrolase [Mangrovitalea sediminis]|uniref:Nudix family hydrolase n=1 Tax=Mangrovitalea sediminis TaxID=1982043 RepID=UPI000BE59920|nr:Nudix family hydrolase [Mangrovitalea sediminis]